ncbi:MAG: hypothetical protein H0W98_08870 [Chloroflexi bacterium]|nr:hypothetical protein [Chloroflexota bacterium]MBA3741240.1 hypothetical protein [Chloroflexota bacterium]
MLRLLDAYGHRAYTHTGASPGSRGRRRREILVSTDAAAAGLDAALERRSLALKGKEGATEVVSLKVAPG